MVKRWTDRMAGVKYAPRPYEQPVAMGTKREIAEQLGVSASTIGYYHTPVYARRTSEDKGRILVEL